MKQKRKIEKINENKSWLFEKLDKIDKTFLAAPSKGGKTQITNIRNENSVSLPTLPKLKEAMPTNWIV